MYILSLVFSHRRKRSCTLRSSYEDPYASWS